MAASVVDLPEPVGPVTSTSPRSFVQSSLRMGGRPSCSSVGISVGIARSTAPGPRLLHEDVHAEAADALELAGEVDLVLLPRTRACCPAFMIESTSAITLSGVERGALGAHQVAVDAQRRRLAGDRCRSDAPFSSASRSSSSHRHGSPHGARPGPWGGRKRDRRHAHDGRR